MEDANKKAEIRVFYCGRCEAVHIDAICPFCGRVDISIEDRSKEVVTCRNIACGKEFTTRELTADERAIIDAWG